MSQTEALGREVQEMASGIYADGSFVNPLQQTIAQKAILQAGILGFTEGLNVSEPERIVDIGVFRVLPTTATADWAIPSGDLAIKTGETYLDFHMPKSEGLSIAKADQGYQQIAEYMKEQPHIGHIIGVTYRIMAISGNRKHGFNTEQIELPQPVMDYASAFWQSLLPDVDPAKFQTAHIVWQTRDQFIDRFGS